MEASQKAPILLLSRGGCDVLRPIIKDVIDYKPYPSLIVAIAPLVDVAQ